MIITIARECGSCGHLIGEYVAKKLNLSFVDKNILIKSAKKNGYYEEYNSFFEERPVSSLLYSIARRSEEFFPSIRERNFIKRLVNGDDNFVIIGLCGNYIFRNEEETVSVFIHASQEAKIKEIMRRSDMSKEEAIKHIKNTEIKRREFHNYYSGEIWGDGKNYDLCIDTSYITPEFAADLIVSYINAKKGQDVTIVNSKFSEVKA
ncbi:AAA family ATPase [Lachnobacterium bovis]|uniref:Cytidylate kinase n=1 Tax=Lachnobacterium bovis TaxID=140626 RepID=A0A1H9UMG7_9FIRM|nr:cytidylate kinase-like family protein [Lachnobacterium bovis]SES10646.1 Cytidylate kinase [Lachnobacterium bovis]